MGLETTADVDQIDGVQDRNGDTRPAANADEQQVTNQKLGNAETVFADKVTPSTGGETLPSHDVKEGNKVLLFADPGNSGPIYVGPNGSATVPIEKGSGMTFSVTSTDALDAMASSTGDVLHVVGEAA